MTLALVPIASRGFFGTQKCTLPASEILVEHTTYPHKPTSENHHCCDCFFFCSRISPQTILNPNRGILLEHTVLLSEPIFSVGARPWPRPGPDSTYPSPVTGGAWDWYVCVGEDRNTNTHKMEMELPLF